MIACVDDKSPIPKPICYKNRYLVNRSDSNCFLSNAQSDFIHGLDNKEDLKNKERIIKIEIVNNKPEADRVFTKKSVSPYKLDRECSLCSNCKSKLESPVLTPNTQRKAVNFTNKSLSNEVHTQQLPLGVPEYPSQNGSLLNFEDVEINPATAEQFIDILIAEDVMLRKKIADGHVDENTLKRLERLTELRQKYMKYKDEQKNQAQNIKPNETLNEETKSKEELKEIENNEENIQQSKHIQSYKPLMIKAKSVISLSDPAFSNELKLHPLVKT